MNRASVLTIAAAVICATLVPLAPASATLDGGVKIRDSFDDSPCGVPVHVEVRGANPVVISGRIFDGGDPRTVNTGHLVQRLTASDGRWMEDDWAGPASRLDVRHLAGGLVDYLVVFDGIREEYRASNGDSVRDVGHLVVDYLFTEAGDFVSRTQVSSAGSFPIAHGDVDFCDFLVAHLG